MAHRYVDSYYNRCEGKVGMTADEFNEWEHMFSQSVRTYIHKKDGFYTGTTFEYLSNNKAISNGYGTQYYNNNEKYEGEWKDGKKSGIGTYNYKDNSIYKGNWFNDKRHGRGILFYPNRTRFHGEWKDDKMIKGHYYFKENAWVGCILEANVDKDNKFISPGIINYVLKENYSSPFYKLYEGSFAFKNIKDTPTDKISRNVLVRHGEGTMFYEYGGRYEGGWKNNKRHGQGKIIDCYGDRYEGEWKDNKKNGQGKYFYKNGKLCYEGEWKDNKKNGQGKYFYKDGDYYEDGDCYEGGWKDNKQHGQGKMIYADVGRYEGEWKDGKKHGQGKQFYENGKLFYEGEWKCHTQCGQGKMFYRDGRRWVGEWKDGKLHGQGKMFYRDGKLKYEGEFKNGSYHGQGKMFYPDGRSYEGEWKDNKRHGQGKMFYENGKRYEGIWKNNKKHGCGTTFDADGKSENSYWLDGHKIDTTTIKDSVRDVDERMKKRFYKFYENSSTKETCAICLDEIEHADFEMRKCSHFFHNDCWTEYKMRKFFSNNKNAICPCCRA